MLKPISFSRSEEGMESVLTRFQAKPSHRDSALTFTQNFVDQMTARFVEEATDGKSLAALMAGGIAYRLGKIAAFATPLGKLPFTPLRHMLVGAVGLASEVTVFEGVNEILSIVGAGFPRSGEATSPLPSKPYGSRWLSSFVNFATLKFCGHISQGQNILFQHLVQDAAMVAANHEIHHLGFGEKPEGSLEEQFLHAEITSLQLGAGTSLAHQITGGRLLALERGLDLALRAEEITPPQSPLFNGGGLWSEAFSGSRSELIPFEKGGISRISPLLIFSVGYKTSPAEARQLRDRMGSLFPIFRPEGYAHEFLESVLRMSLPHPLFRERLLEAYAFDPRRGLPSQRETVKVVEKLFQHDALEEGIGSIEEAYLQYLFRSALSEDRAPERVGYLHELFRLLEGEPDRVDIENQAKRWGLDGVASISAVPQYPPSFQNTFQRLVELEWGLLCAEHQVTLLNFVYHLFPSHPPHAAEVIRLIGKNLRSPRYPTQDIEEALDAARKSPFGLLILQRLFQVMATQDVPAKIRELQPPRPDDHFSFLWKLASSGTSPEEIALRINGTRMTAYLPDMRLARKVTEVYLEVRPFLEAGDAKRSRSLRRLIDTVERKAREKKPFTAFDLLDLLRVNPDERIEKLFRGLERERFQILMLPPEEFARHLPEGSKGGTCSGALFVESSSPWGKDRILIEEIPAHLVGGEFVDVVLNRVMGVVHEWGHFLHVRGEEGERASSLPLSLRGISRQDRLTSELMAFLEEHRWRVKYTDVEYWELAAKIGLNFPLYLRNLNDRLYFEETNRQLLSHFQP